MEKQVFAHTRLSLAYLALAKLSCKRVNVFSQPYLVRSWLCNRVGSVVVVVCNLNGMYCGTVRPRAKVTIGSL